MTLRLEIPFKTEIPPEYSICTYHLTQLSLCSSDNIPIKDNHMTHNFIYDDSSELAQAVEQKIAEFNWRHWEVSERLPLGLKLEDENGDLLAGFSARTFGNWLQIDNLWVSESLRGQQFGAQLLAEAERIAIKRGCIYAILDTLNFQARPFYEAKGYTLQWTQEAYPRTGCKYFMIKNLETRN